MPQFVSAKTKFSANLVKYFLALKLFVSAKTVCSAEICLALKITNNGDIEFLLHFFVHEVAIHTISSCLNASREVKTSKQNKLNISLEFSNANSRRNITTQFEN